jgi:hypothetical protein
MVKDIVGSSDEDTVYEMESVPSRVEVRCDGWMTAIWYRPDGLGGHELVGCFDGTREAQRYWSNLTVFDMQSDDLFYRLYEHTRQRPYEAPPKSARKR